MIRAIKMGLVFSLFCIIVFIVAPYVGGDFVDTVNVANLVVFLCFIPLLIGFAGSYGLLQPASAHFGWKGIVRWAIFGIVVGSLGEISTFLRNTNRESFPLFFLLLVIGGASYWLLFRHNYGYRTR